MLAYLIDTVKLEVREVEISGDYREIYKLIDCEIFTVVAINDSDVIYVDDEGLLVDLRKQTFFMYNGIPQPLAGKGLVLGTDMETGESTSPKISLMEVIKAVSYMTFYQVQRWARDNPDL
jgi:hypothetical protein